MPQEITIPSREVLGARMAMLGRKIKRAQELASRTDDILYAVLCELKDLQDMIIKCSIGVPSGSSQASFRVRVTPKRYQPREAFPEVGSLLLLAHANRSAVAQIEGRSSIPLPPAIAALLHVLMAEGGVSTDHLVGWKSIAEIQARLKERTRQRHSKAAIKELVYRLRRLLEKHGENPSLVQNNGPLGYRFAVRSNVISKTERDNV
jgi:DNA-binding response OmpR family regulator